MKGSSKLIGTVFIVAGTTIGASMLALPLVAAKVGRAWALVLMALSWGFMLTNACLTLRMMEPYPKSATFRSVTKDTLGVFGKNAMTGSMMFLFYSLLAAYGAGASSILLAYIPIGQMAMVTLLFVVLGGVILWSDAMTDYLNRALFISLLVFVLVAMVPLMGMMGETSLDWAFAVTPGKSLLTALLIYITSFGFHGSIASLVKYNNKDMVLLKRAFFAGTLLAVVLYMIWMGMTASILDAPGLEEVSHVIAHLSNKTGHAWVGVSLSLFALVAILTSFIGVGMGLSNDFRGLLEKRNVPQRFMRGVLTFLPPYFLVCFNPSIFVRALEYAGVALMLIAVLLPNLALQRLMSQGRIEFTGFERGLSWIMILASGILIPCYFLFG